MTQPVLISVALCTCNGAQFLAAQLASLANQTHPPWELVVCDDASDDSTWDLLNEFKHGAHFSVRLYRNEHRLGIGQNFEQAIRLCTGQVIALCDQDDVWLPEKLTLFAEKFSKGADAIGCDACVTDAALVPLGYTLWDRVAFHSEQRRLARSGRLMEVLFKHHVVAGATLAFRAELREQLLPIPENWLYDAWLASVLAACGKLVILDACLQMYRQHQNNAIGGRRLSLMAQLRSASQVVRMDYLNLELFRWQQFFARVKTLEMAGNSLQPISEKLDHLQRRIQFPNHRLLRVPYLLAEMARRGYSRFSRNWGSIALDLWLK